MALSVYLGHFPTMSHARQAVAEIIAADLRDRDRALGEAVSYES